MSSVPAVRRHMSRRMVFAVAVVLALAAVPAAQAHDTSTDFVTRSGSQLILAGQPYTFTGINLYNANSDGWCRDALTDTEFETALDSAGLGDESHGVLRAWFFQTLATDKGTRARDWTRFDRTIAIAKAKGYKVIATLADQWGECGTDVTPTYSYKTEDWYTGGYTAPDPGMAAGAYGPGWQSYRDWVAEVVARYDDEPAVLAWQLINEAEVNPGGAYGACPSGDGPRDVLRAWATDMSNLVRSLDASHLISLGTIGGGQCGSQGSQYQDVHDLPNIDLCEVHDYTPTQAIPGDQWNGFGVRVQQCAALDKPLIVGETGINPARVGGSLDDRAMAFRSKIHAQTALGVDGIVAWNYHPGGSTLDNFDIGPGDPALAELAYPEPPILVTSDDDTDDFACDAAHCSLREAISAANAQPGTDLIAFSIPGSGTHTIPAGSALPEITDAVLIDGTTQPGTAGTPLIVLDGTSAGPGVPGLSASAADVTIRGLRITGFDGAGIGASGAGLRVDGSTIDGNGGDGISVTAYPYDASFSANRIHDNGGLGIDLGDDGPSFFDPQAPSLGVSSYGDQVSGSISGDPGVYTVDMFKVGACDPSGYGEGDVPIGSLEVTVPSGFPSYASFEFSPPGGIALGDTFAATATNPSGATSEFSSCASRPRPNLSLAIDDETDLVGVGEPVRYLLTVSNATQVYANGIVLEHTLPAGATFGQAVPSQGTCGEAGGVVTCQLGSLVGQSWGAGIITVAVDVRPGSAETATTTATVSATGPESNQLDNDATETTTVAAVTPATFTVNSPNDASDGTCNAAHCSLREAILAANANPGRDTITFDLAGSRLIQPASPGLPTLTGPVVIDATTNPGFAGQPVVELAGPSPFGGYGLKVAAGDSEVRGLILNGWQSPAVLLERWGGNVVAGNWFGLDSTGTIRTPNGSAAIVINTPNNLIGGTTAADRNVLSGSSTGVTIVRSGAAAPVPHHNVVQGNYVGLNAAGTAGIWTTSGIVVNGDDNTIGGAVPGAGNVVGAGVQDGILVTGEPAPGPASNRNVIQGNVVGLDATGSTAVPNGTGIRVHLNSRDTKVGGPAPGEGNTVAGNQYDGINVFNMPQDTVIAGNRIGTLPDGISAMPNGRHGIILEGGGSPRTTIGGTAPGSGNVIANNAFDGVSLQADGAAVLGNSIHANGGLGIDRSPTTQASDIVTSTPASLAFPVLTDAVTQGGITTVAGTLASSPGTAYRIELFSNAACDPVGNGEGQALIAAFDVTTDGSGGAGFSVPLATAVPGGTVITATSTSTAVGGQTSEFSACLTAPPPADQPVTATVTSPNGGPVTVTGSTIVGPPPAGSGYTFVDYQLDITAPAADTVTPLLLVFTVDATLLASLDPDLTADTLTVFRDGDPVDACTPITTDDPATPDPCVSLRETLTGGGDEGDARITVLASHASTWNFGSLPPLTEPAAPTGATAVRGDARATVTWTPPADDGGSPITGYTVTSTPGGLVAVTGGSESSAIVTGLVNGTSYTFTVHATNAVGDGPESAPSNAVTPRAPVAQAITFAKPATQLMTTSPFTATATASSGLPVSLTASTTAVCTASGLVITFVMAGTCTVTAGQAGNDDYLPAPPVTRSFTINQAGQTITFTNPGSKTLLLTPFSVTATAASGLPVTVTSTTASVCTVSGFEVTLLAAGTCSLTASQAGNAVYKAATAVTRSFSVTKATQAITFPKPATATLIQSPMTVTATANSGQPVTVVSTTAAVCTVSGFEVTLLTAGSCSLTAGQAGNAVYAAANSISRSFSVTKAPQSITFPNPGPQSMLVSTVVLSPLASSNLPVSLASTTTTICTVSGDVATLKKAGTCKVKATQAGNAVYAAAPAVTIQFTVSASTPLPSVVASGASLAAGG